MQKLFFPMLAGLLLLAAACSNDFDVTAPWKEVPVTYAMLDAKASAQYIRVEKAFLDPEESALRVAQIADSLYYPANAISVFLEQLSGGQVVKTYACTRVDGRDEGIVRDTGIFATQPNWLYKAVTTPDSLVPGASYRVVIKRNDNKPDVTGTTVVPANFRWADPVVQDLLGPVPKINFDTSGRVTFAWRSDAAGTYFNLKFTIRYREVNPATGAVLERKTLVWDVFRNEKRNETATGSQPTPFRTLKESPSLFQFLANNIAPTTDRVRYFEPCDLFLEGGGAEIEDFLEIVSANSGISGAEVVPQYTNMSEGVGVVTTKNSLITPNIRIGSETIDLISEHPTTKALNFRL